MSIRRLVICLSLAFLAVVMIGIPFRSQLSSASAPQTPTVIAGRNVNMVSGTTLPGGDPWLQRQNEPTIAVSSRNPMHLLAGANDYRTVDMPTSEGELPGKTPVAMVGDAWLGVFTSNDGGESWTSTMLPGFPQDPNPNNPLKNFSTASDPVVRSGPNGIFYYSGIAFNRTTNLGVVFVARFIDNNNSEGGNTIQYIDTKIIATGIEGTVTKLFLDKPWIAVDQPRAPMTNITVAGQSIPRHNVYIAYSAFSGQGSTLGDIMFARSNDCGTTWGKPIKISTGSYAHQGATIAIKPVLGEVLVAWRRFSQAKTADSIFVALSFSLGLDFQSPIKVADIAPFDQPTTDGVHSLPGTANGYAFRINSYPTMTVDKSGHVYLAWSQRPNSGYARIMLSYSYLGLSWSTPQPVANGLGHQIMPSFSFSAGKLMLVWYDQRNDVSGNIYGFNNWIIDSLSFLPGFPYRHTMDVWAAMADTAAFPNLSWKSTQVSRYLYAATYDSNGNPTVYPVQFNCVNYPLFKGGTNPFDGDYIDVAASPSFRLDSWRNWIFNTDNANSPEFHVAWTDNRDVRPPVSGDWTLYRPPSSGQSPEYVTSGRPECGTLGDINGPGMRNQNIYTSRITWGIEAGSPVNDKPLSLPGSPARAFVVYVKNNTQSLRSFALTIAAQPVGGQASFLQFGLLASLNVDIAPYSTISRPVFISSSDSSASVTVNIKEINASGSIITGGLTSSILINGDPTNPNPANPSTDETHDPSIVSATPNIVNWYVNPNIVNPNIVNPNIVNPNIVNPNIVNPNIVNTDPNNPNIVNPNIVNPNIVNPNIVNPNIVNPNIVNPNIVNPNIVNPNIVNAAPADVSATDVQWTVTNAGSATTSYTLKTLAKMSPPEGVYAQLLVYRVHYTPAVAGAELSSATGISACTLMQEPHQELVLNVLNPNIVNPNIVNPNIVNPNIVNSSIEDATFSVAPGEEIIVDLRVLDTGVSSTTTTSAATMKALSATTSTQALTTQEFIHSLGFAVTSQAVNSTDVAAGSQIPPAAASTLVIGTGSLPDGVAGTGYQATLRAYGGTGTYTWSLNSGALPTGLSLVTYNGGGLISGTPTTAGTSHFIVRVDDGIQFDTQQYYIVINSATGSSPLSIVTTTLPSGVQGNWYGATLEATGGVWPRTWSLASGALPSGLILDSGGVISGTPTVSGSFSFAVRVTAKNGTAVTQGLSLVIAANSMIYYKIAGTVYDENGYPLQGAVVRGLPDTPVSGVDGTYLDLVPAGWSGTTQAFMVGHTFVPATYTYTNVSADQLNQNFNHTQAATQQWVARYNGPGNDDDGVMGIAVDSSGNVYVTGYSVGDGTNYDYATIKYDPNGNPLWTARYDGPGHGDDEAMALAVDSVGNAYVTGYSLKGDHYECVTVKYDTIGNQAWSATHYGPLNGDTMGVGITVDSLGNVYVAGRSSGSYGGYILVTIKYDSNGNELWTADYPAACSTSAIIVDSSGNVYVIGSANGDYATIKYNSNGSQLWAATYNGPGNGPDGPRRVAVDPSGNVYVTGWSTGIGTGKDIATIKYDSNGNQLWVARYNGPGNGDDGVQCVSIVLDSAGNVDVLGDSAGSGTGLDYATIKYDTNGNQLWVARYNGPGNGNDTPDRLAVDPMGNVYVVGASPGNGTGLDYATVKYDTNGNQLWVTRYNGPGNGDDWSYLIALDPLGNVLVGGGSTGSGTGADYATVKYAQSFPSTLIITTNTLDNGYVGTPYAKALWAFGGSGSRTWSKTSGNLPPGMDLSVVTGIISGTPTTPGTYNFTVQVADGTLNATMPLSMIITTLSTASFSYSPDLPPAGQAVQFTDTSAGSPTSWQWNFSDGGTSTIQSPSHTFASSGFYTVSMTATGASGSQSMSHTIFVVPALAASFTYSPASPVLGQAVQFTNTSVGYPTACQWDFGDGGISVSYNPIHYFQTAGSYTVTLTLSNASGSASARQTVNITAPDLVVSSLTHSPANPTTADTITFVATVQNIGNAAAGASVLRFQVGGETYPPTYNVPSLAPGATFQVTRTAQLTVAQNYQNTATADVTNAVAESNETNNVTTDTFTVTAPQYTLTVTISPLVGSGAGSVAVSPNQTQYASGTVVTLTATANSNWGYVFGGWSGDATGSNNPTTVTMNGAKSITATFYVATLLVNNTSDSIYSIQVDGLEEFHAAYPLAPGGSYGVAVSPGNHSYVVETGVSTPPTWTVVNTYSGTYIQPPGITYTIKISGPGSGEFDAQSGKSDDGGHHQRCGRI
jgi:PKD repeat protein